MENFCSPYLSRETRHFVVTRLHYTEHTLLTVEENGAARSSQKGFAKIPTTLSSSSAFVFFRVVGSNNVYFVLVFIDEICFLVLFVVVDT